MAVPAAIQIVTAVEPLILLVITAIKAHMNATNGTFPTPEQVQAALPADSATLKSIWDVWSAAHPLTPPVP